jgi:1-hydroxycarotenoid 3,4-desaturase
MAANNPHVVVVGAGMGGLVAALLLASKGVRVTVLDAAASPGGKLRQLWVDGVAVDAGPTVFTMPWVFEEILAAANATLADLPGLTRLPVLARHAWRGQEQTLDLFADAQRSVQAVAAFSGPAEARRFGAFCSQAQQVYRHLEQPYLRAQRPSLLSMSLGLGPKGLLALTGLGPFSSLWSNLSRRFTDPRLRQLFGRYATYCGASPWLAPATLMLIAQVEMDGVWSVTGGLHALAIGLAGLAQKRGATLRYASPCQRIHLTNGRVSGVELGGAAAGEMLNADAVVFNGDPQALVQGLLGDPLRQAAPPLARSQRSLSALTWAVHAPTQGFDLERHNVFFDTDYASEFDDIFTKRRLPSHGTVYVCAQDRGDLGPGASTLAGQPERLLCLINAPPDGDQRPFASQETDPCEHHLLALTQACGLHIQGLPQRSVVTTPATFNQLYPGSGGALYGAATHGWMSSFRRPSARSLVPGLFLAGGSVHPGPGVPMAALSGQLAAVALMAHLGSTKQWRGAATSGGTLTPSATTGNRG